MLTLRPFLPTDDDALIAWLPTAEDLHRFTGPRLRHRLDSAQLDELRADDTFTMFTAEVDGTVVGHAEFVSTGADSARLARVLVDPARRGQGLGERLVLAMIEEARARGIRSLNLYVLDDNTRAVRLYEKLGFETVGASGELSGAREMQIAP